MSSSNFYPHYAEAQPKYTQQKLSAENSYNKSIQYQIQDIIELELKAKLETAKGYLSQMLRENEQALTISIKSRDEYIVTQGYCQNQRRLLTN